MQTACFTERASTSLFYPDPGTSLTLYIQLISVAQLDYPGFDHHTRPRAMVRYLACLPAVTYISASDNLQVLQGNSVLLVLWYILHSLQLQCLCGEFIRQPNLFCFGINFSTANVRWTVAGYSIMATVA